MKAEENPLWASALSVTASTMLSSTRFNSALFSRTSAFGDIKDCSALLLLLLTGVREARGLLLRVKRELDAEGVAPTRTRGRHHDRELSAASLIADGWLVVEPLLRVPTTSSVACIALTAAMIASLPHHRVTAIAFPSSSSSARGNEEEDHGWVCAAQAAADPAHPSPSTFFWSGPVLRLCTNTSCVPARPLRLDKG